MTDPVDLAERRRERVARQYRELKAIDPEALRECVGEATRIIDKHAADLSDSLRLELAADIEQALVAFAHRRIL